MGTDKKGTKDSGPKNRSKNTKTSLRRRCGRAWNKLEDVSKTQGTYQTIQSVEVVKSAYEKKQQELEIAKDWLRKAFSLIPPKFMKEILTFPLCPCREIGTSVERWCRSRGRSSRGNG